jgi:hypothetical protein
VRKGLGSEDDVTGFRVQVLVAEAKHDLAFDEMEYLILIPVDVERWRIAVRGPVLQHGNPVLARRARNPHRDPRIEEPEMPAIAACRFHESPCDCWRAEVKASRRARPRVLLRLECR